MKPKVVHRQKKIWPSRQEVNPVYRDTKTVEVKTRLLKKNKIICPGQEDKFVDRLKILRSQTIDRLKESGANALLITSPKYGEGKTFIAINLAVCIAFELEHTVLLVDADLKKPRVHRYLHCENKKGLSDYLLGDAQIPDLLINPGIPKMTVLPAGRRLAHTSEILAGPKMENLIKEMKQRYPERFIVFDTSPLLTSADARVMSNLVDGVLLVVQAEKTSQKDLRHAMEVMGGKPVLGTVLNKY